jgi:uracil phosphoribosyltransferase
MTKKFHQLNHPIFKHKLGILRDKNTTPGEFRELVKEISKLLAFTAMTDWNEFEEVNIETPIAPTKVSRIKNFPIAVSIMRAGNPVQDAVLSLLPCASAGHIGMHRDPNDYTKIVEYFFKLPKNHEGKTVLLCEPLLATANTAIVAIDKLKNCKVGKIKLLCILVSKHGIEKLHKAHPDVEVFALHQEEIMNDHGYLVPGLGDAGDRIYNSN